VNRFDSVRRLHTLVFHIDGKIGAEQGAQPAVDARGIIGDGRGVVPFAVRMLGHDQDALGAELDAKTATFAPFLNDMNDATGHLDAVSIQGLSPISHSPSSSSGELAAAATVYQGTS
jgi:hypothetical protein